MPEDDDEEEEADELGEDCCCWQGCALKGPKEMREASSEEDDEVSAAPAKPRAWPPE